MPFGLDEARQQVLANSSALPHYASFSEHRQRLTSLTLDAAGARPGPSLCVLGAGNCFDLDLEALADRFSSIHLVDLDAGALTRAREQTSAATRARVQLHAPLDLTGFLDRIDRWAGLQVTPEELMAHPARTAEQLRTALSGPFDVVLSSCILSQMQLSVLNVLGDRHRLFHALRLISNLTHWRTLAELTRPGGCALFATDVSSNELHPLDQIAAGADCRPLLENLVKQGKIFDFADPSQIAAQLRDDPALERAFATPDLRDAWVWCNGPQTKFLVYASALARR